jgi:hypothetical protein
MSFLNRVFNVLRFNRKNWKAVVLCIFTATIFWFFNALNKTYTTNINFPLRFEYDQQNFIPVEDLPQFVMVNVTGNGWELFKRSTGLKINPLEIPLERPAETKKIVGRGTDLTFAFSNQLPGLEINHVINDTLHVDLEPKLGRWIKVTVDSIHYNLRQGYGLASDIAIDPDSTYVVGPARMVNKIKEPVILDIPQRNIDDNYSENVKVEVPFLKVMNLEPAAVSVRFNVEEMITIQDSIALKIENIPPIVSDISTTGKIPVTLSVPESFVEGLKMDSLKAVLDLAGFEGGKKKFLPRVDGLPPHSSVTKIDSVIVRL